MSRKVVIVGGVAGGATAAARIRRLDEQAELVVFERSGYISYANCGLPYYVGGVITDPEELTLQDPESFYSRFRVVMKVHHEVTAIHPGEKTVEVKNFETGETFTETYDSLINIPIQINGQVWNLRCGFSGKNMHYDVYGLWEGFDSQGKMFNRNVKSLAQFAGQEFRLLDQQSERT